MTSLEAIYLHMSDPTLLINLLQSSHCPSTYLSPCLSFFLSFICSLIPSFTLPCVFSPYCHFPFLAHIRLFTLLSCSFFLLYSPIHYFSSLIYSFIYPIFFPLSLSRGHAFTFFLSFPLCHFLSFIYSLSLHLFFYCEPNRKRHCLLYSLLTQVHFKLNLHCCT